MKLSVILTTVLIATSSLPGYAAATCESLALLPLPKTAITIAQPVPAGTFVLPKDFAGSGQCWFQPCPAANSPGDVFKNLPGFCRIAATLRPTGDSEIKVEVWMPSTGWNHKFMAVGNGAWAGTITYAGLAVGISKGYAVASTNTGHDSTGFDASFAIGHPEKFIDFGYRAVHEMTVIAKEVIAAYYGSSATRSYWNGCSSGGRQGLMEAQRFPTDFDGIIAGAPANNTSRLTAHTFWIAQALYKDEASYIPPSKYPMIHNEVLAECDTLDSVKDGVIDDPRRCKFDPKVLECKSKDGPECLTPAQVDTARKIYSPAVNPRTKESIFPPFEPGGELGWGARGIPPKSHWHYVVVQDPNWDYKTFNFDTDLASGEKIENDTLNATSPDLKAFFSRGGKLLQYHGWSDTVIAPGNSVNYYTRVLDATQVTKLDESYRLFMVPGMGHCGDGEGPNQFDVLGAMEEWVEKENAPNQIVATRMVDAKPERTRPLCPYPQVAVYTGVGSTNDAANFHCSVQK